MLFWSENPFILEIHFDYSKEEKERNQEISTVVNKRAYG